MTASGPGQVTGKAEDRPKSFSRRLGFNFVRATDAEIFQNDKVIARAMASHAVL